MWVRGCSSRRLVLLRAVSRRDASEEDALEEHLHRKYFTCQLDSINLILIEESGLKNLARSARDTKA